MAMGKARSSAVKKFNLGNTSDLFLLIIMCSFLPTRNARLIPHLTEACKSYLDSSVHEAAQGELGLPRTLPSCCLGAFRHLWPLPRGGGLAAPFLVRAPCSRVRELSPHRRVAARRRPTPACVARHTPSLSPPSPPSESTTSWCKIQAPPGCHPRRPLRHSCEHRMTARGGQRPRYSRRTRGMREVRAGSGWRAGARSLSLATEKAGIEDPGF